MTETQTSKPNGKNQQQQPPETLPAEGTQYVLVEPGLFNAALQLLQTELPMIKARAVVQAMETCQVHVINITDDGAG